MKNIIANIVRGKSLTYLAAAFAALAAAQTAQAADRYWNSTSVGGSEESPYDIWDTANWDGSIGSGNQLNLSVSEKTYFKSESDVRIGNDLRVNSGDFVFLGPLTFQCLKNNIADASVTVLKKGDWKIQGYQMYIGFAAGSTMAFTNATGNVTVTGTYGNLYIADREGSTGEVVKESGDWSFEKPAYIGNGKDTTARFYNRGGNLAVAGDLVIAKGEGSSAEIVKESGDWSASSTVYIGNGKNSTARFYNRGGSLTAARYGICLGENASGTTGSAYLEISGGAITNTAGHFCIGDGNCDGTAEVLVNGGEYCAKVGSVQVGNRGQGTLTIDSGRVIAPASGVIFCNDANCVAGRDCLLNLNGGTLETKTVTYGSGAANATFTFNGGTLKALQAGTLIASNDKLTVTVGANGGTIDANGYSVNIAKALTGTGCMTYQGGGMVTLSAPPTYTGTTTVEVGTTLVVPSAITGDKLAFTIPEGIADGVYEVVHISGGGVFAADVLAHASLPSDVNAYFFLNSGKTGIYCRYGVVSGDGKVWVGIAGDRKLSSAENWLDNTAPSNGDILNFSRASASISLDADLGEVVPATMLFGNKLITITNGTLTVNTLTNATKLAIGAGASLEVEGDIVARAIDYRGSMTFLNSNKGTVIVHGNAVGTSTTSASVFEYADISEANNPMQVGGIRYISAGSATYFHLDTNKAYRNDGPGDWVIGENGIGYTSGATGYYAEWFGHVKLYSSADWTLQNSMDSGLSAELSISGHASMTFNTSDYNDPTTPRTITLKGRLRSGTDYNDSTAGFFIEGCGKVVIDTEDMSALSMDEDKKHTYFDNSQLTVKSGATLQVNAGKKILGTTGRIALEAGATLALVSSGTADFAERIEPALKLPTEGAANIRIDGQRLKSGDYTILSNVTAGATANVNLDMRGTALVGRKRASLAVDGSNLVLNIEPSAMIIVVR